MDLTGYIEIASISDTGMQRNHNEDSVASNAQFGVTVLADGMGGYKAGEVASAIAVNTIMTELEGSIDKIKPTEIDDESGYTKLSVLVRDLVKSANEAIFNTATSQPQYKGMGTTLVMALFYNNRMTIAHVGDSRLYRIKEDKLEQITQDHTLLQELIDRGFYTEEQARNSPNKNLVTRALGVDNDVEVDIQEEIVTPGEKFLLCSDGLTDMLEDEEINLILEKYSDNIETCAQVLIDQANEKGGFDNVSVIIANVVKPFPSDKKLMSRVVDWFF